MVHQVKIAGVTYGNVGSLSHEIVRGYYHNETALDGTHYQDLRYKKTNYTATFFNLLDGVYTTLKDYINANEGNIIICGFPDGDSFKMGNYRLSIQSENDKGYLNGVYFKNGMTVLFEAVNADEE